MAEASGVRAAAADDIAIISHIAIVCIWDALFDIERRVNRTPAKGNRMTL